MWAAAAAEHVPRAFAALSVLVCNASTGAAWPALPPDPETGFYLRYHIDGRQVDRPEYGFRHHDFVIVRRSSEKAEGARERSFWLDVASHKSEPVLEGVQLRVWEGFRLDVDKQSFALTGARFCMPAVDQPKRVVAEAKYARVTPQTQQPLMGQHFSFGFPLIWGTADEEAANTGTEGFETQGPGLLGRYEGQLLITRIDPVNQVIEGRFEFDAGRQTTVHKNRWGAWEARCAQAGDFVPASIRVSGGEFRLRYCTDPPQPGNSRYCPGSLSPEAPR